MITGTSQLGDMGSDLAMSCEMSTLEKCYGDDLNRFSAFRICGGGVLCRFENRMMISCDVQLDEVISFAKVLGVNTIEYPTQLIASRKHCKAYSVYSVFAFENSISDCDDNVMQDCNVNMHDVFDILCQSDERFKLKAHYLPWLSDCIRHRNMNLGHVYLLQNIATASITAKSFSCALISQVATLPEKRNNGVASRLLRHVCSQMQKEQLTPIIISASPSLDEYYKNLGFTKISERTILTI